MVFKREAEIEVTTNCSREVGFPQLCGLSWQVLNGRFQGIVLHLTGDAESGISSVLILYNMHQSGTHLLSMDPVSTAIRINADPRWAYYDRQSKIESILQVLKTTNDFPQPWAF